MKNNNKGGTFMTKKYLVKLGAPILAIALMAACGNADNNDNNDLIDDNAPAEDPVEEEAPMDEEAPLEDPVDEIEDDVPLNEDGDLGDRDNGNENEGDIDPILNDDNDDNDDNNQ